MMFSTNTCKLLKGLSNFSTMSEIEQFESILCDIADDKDERYLPILFELLDDNSDFLDVLTSVEMTIESYPGEVYISYLLINLSTLSNRIPNYCGFFFSHIFNSPDYLEILKKGVHIADRDTLLQFLDFMYNNRSSSKAEEHRKIIENLRELANQPS